MVHYSGSETESCDGHGVEIAVPPPQPPERGRHERARDGESEKGDTAAQQRPGRHGNQNGARRNAATLQRTPRRSARRASFGSSVAQSTSR